MRLAYFTNTYPRATDTFIRREVIGLRERGFDVRTYSVRRTGADHDVDEEVIREKASTRYILPADPATVASAVARWAAKAPVRFSEASRLAAETPRPGGKGALLQGAYLLEAVLLADMLAEDGIEHLHNHLGDNSGTVTMLAAKLLGIPYSISIHGPHIFFDGPHWALAEKTANAAFITCIGHFCTSQMMLYADRADWHKLEIVRCGIDPEAFAYRAPSGAATEVLYVGRLAGEKGVPILFESMIALREQGLDLHLTLCGDGEARADLEALAERTGVNVTFAGFVDQPTVRRKLAESDIFVLPSFAEGIPVSLMEAMAIGVPVIATYVGGVVELVEDGVTGQVVHAADPLALADAIARYATDPELCRCVSAGGRARVESEFAIGDQVDRLARLFRGERRVYARSSQA